MRLKGWLIQTIIGIVVLAAIIVPLARQTYLRCVFDHGGETYRRTHPLLAYAIEPVSTDDTQKTHARGLRSYMPHSGPFSWVRHATLGNSITLVSFSPSSRYLAVVVWPSTVIIFDVQNRREQSRFYYREGNDINKVLWSPDDRFITMGRISGPETPDRAADVWDPKTGKVIAKLKGYPMFSAISPDGKHIISRVFHNIDGRPVHSWRLYDTSDWSYRDWPKPLDNPSLASCEDAPWRPVIYQGVTWTANDKIAMFGFWETNEKQVPCSMDGKNPLPTGLFAATSDPEGKAAPFVKNLEFNKYGDTGNPDPAQDSTYPGKCDLAYNHAGHFITYASGLTIDVQNLKLRRPAIKYSALPNCNYNTADATGNYIYTVDISDLTNLHSTAIGIVQSVKDGNLVATFPVGRTSLILGGASASPDGRYLAITSYNVVDIYRTQ